MFVFESAEDVYVYLVDVGSGRIIIPRRLTSKFELTTCSRAEGPAVSCISIYQSDSKPVA